MSFVKKYEVGNARLDAPKTHFVHEIPLLVFGDARYNIGLSLVFNSGTTENSFNIFPGYKFNLQKRLILGEGGLPKKLEDGSGATVDLISYSTHFMFDDDSQRIIRVQGNTFRLENPDYSVEMYDVFGRITTAYDKYGEVYLTYSYSSSGKLDKITYRNSKIIQFNYFEAEGRVKSVQYICNGETICTTTFSYPNGANIVVCHYSGVDYCITFSQGEFVIYSVDHGEGYSNDHSQKITCNLTSTSLTITKRFGDKVVDATTYVFANCPEEGKFDLLDVTDQYGIKTRFQFENGNLAYSYEIRDDMFCENSETQSCTYFGTVTHHSNGQTIGAQTYGDGIRLINYDSNKWWYPIATMMDESEWKNVKSVIVSGWVKKKPNSFVVGERRLGVTFDDYNVLSNKELLFGELPLNQWVYFSGIIDLSERIEKDGEVQVIESIDLDAPIVTLSENPTYFEGADIRIVPQYANGGTGSTSNHITGIENVLLISGTTHEQKLDSNTSFYNGNVKLDNLFTEKDIIKYQLNQAVGLYRNEIYFNNCRGIRTNVTDFKVGYTDSSGHPAKAKVEDVVLEKRYTMNGHRFLLRTEVSSSGSDYLFTTKTLLNGLIYKEEQYDSKFDLLRVNNDGAITTYGRNNKGLILSRTVADENENIIATTSTTYNADNTKLISETDAIGTVTTYTTDDVWGAVTQVKVNNEIVVSSAYDDDCSTQMSKTFGEAPNTKLHEFGYANGALHMIKNDTLIYTLGYTKDALTSIEKNNQPIEQIEILENGKQLKSHYPNCNNPQYTITRNYDDYGRLTQVEGLITNTYDIHPTIQSGVHNVIGINNGSSKLATSTDHITGTVEKYGYTKDKLSQISKVNSIGNEVSTESFVYDTLGRLTTNLHVYDVEGNKSVGSEIAYEESSTHPSADNTVYSYTYKINNGRRAYCYNEYDEFKRLKKKNITITPENRYITKTFAYDGFRVRYVAETFSNKNLGNNTYTYDERGRIESDRYLLGIGSSRAVSYKYDNHGQLVRENNESLDKTYIYEYNNIGNIKLVKTYEYSSSEELECCCTPTTYEYDSTYPDRLISLNGNEITYNAQGYPSFYKGKSYNWIRGKLTKINKGSSSQYGSLCDECIFTYDALGRRTAKNYVYDTVVGSSDSFSYRYSTRYQYDHSGRLIREFITEHDTDGEETTREFIYLYDETGMIGVMYNSTVYYYHRNLQGDVIAIYNTNGEKIVEYAYDAWGNCTLIYAEDLGFANANPIRYRGYYFDRETGLYYLNARYYSPEWRRFISPDDTGYLDPESANGLNLYAYCNNDPVNYADPSGHSAILTMVLIGTLVGAAVGFGFDAGKQLIDNGFDFSQVDWGIAVNSAIVGGALGFSLAMGVGYLGPVIAGTAVTGGLTAGGAFAISTSVSFGAGALGYASEEWINGRTPSFGKAMMHGGFVALEGMVKFAAGGFMGSLGNVGTKGKFLISKEWWGKFILGLAISQPFKTAMDLIRNNI